MASVEEAQQVLEALGMPPPQRNRMAGLTLLALCQLRPGSPWSKARRTRCTVTKGVMDFLRDHYGMQYAANTRETFRRQVLHQFVQAGLAEFNPYEPDLPTNSPNAHYAVTPSALKVVRTFGGDGWERAAERFLQSQAAIAATVRRGRERRQVPVRIPEGRQLLLSPGRHNEVQRAVVEVFAPRFAPGAHLLYLGDTAKKDLWLDEEGLAQVGVPVTMHDKLADVMLHDTERGWLFLVEVVTSHGPVTPKRLLELTDLAKDASVGLVFVTAFPDAREFRKHMGDIAWETEVWMADAPDHMIHYNGDRFLGPRLLTKVPGDDAQCALVCHADMRFARPMRWPCADGPALNIKLGWS